MKEFHCKYCQEKMETDSLAYKANSYCNMCFDDRAGSEIEEEDEIFVYNGIEIQF